MTLAQAALGLTWEARITAWCVGAFIVFSASFAYTYRLGPAKHESAGEHLGSCLIASTVVGVGWPLVPPIVLVVGWLWLITRPGPLARRKQRLQKARETVARLERDLGITDEAAA